MNTVSELLEILSSYGITQCEECKSWGEGMNIEENCGLIKCHLCHKEGK